MARARGFTLVELLVAISIIAILSVTAMVIYSQVTVNARDARRKMDLQTIAQALEVYYQKNGRYPITGWVRSNEFGNWIVDMPLPYPSITFVPDYINSLPQDPKSNGGNPSISSNPWGYVYWSRSYKGCPPPGQWYILAAVLENQSDPDRLAVKDYKFCDGSSLETMWSWSPNTYVITPR